MRPCIHPCSACRLTLHRAAVSAANFTTIEVFPPDINSTPAADGSRSSSRRLIADGITRDVTAEAKVSFANPALVKLDKNIVYPVADGATELTVEFDGQNVTVPVTVKDAEGRPARSASSST